MTGWLKTDENTPTDERHIRGLYVVTSHRSPNQTKHWEAYVGCVDGNGFGDDGGNDTGWTPADFTHWLPLPLPPEQEGE